MGGWPSLWAGDEASMWVNLGSALLRLTFLVLFHNMMYN